MTKDALRDALTEAHRFIAAANAVTFKRVDDGPLGTRKGEDIIATGKLAAHLRRVSHDLTMRLAELRQSAGRFG